ncbi:hypothetical protein KKF81_05975 [Candidatus Micrarchaeota archaeon]|nr:hypothetical protein [Candidatus Micrarchaeota archaeon]MBU1166476.1 hypothetical protein [Candidatus Micrarchaeota archaeon]MBU1886182.1 hypothetical protein [Candidatus Micrarchaeota archaeon]
MLLGQLRQMMNSAEEKEDDMIEKRTEERKKSSDAESFLKTPEARSFIKKWHEKTKNGHPMYTKRGVTSLLRSLFQIPGLEKDKDVFDSANELLSMLGGMDGLSGFLMGWKAKSEGIMKALKVAIGGGKD